jgi:alpha-N-acetylglucosamine transferase
MSLAIETQLKEDVLPRWTGAPTRTRTRGRRFWASMSVFLFFGIYFVLNMSDISNSTDFKAVAQRLYTSHLTIANSQMADKLPKAEYAFATLLTGSSADPVGNINADHYFVSTRMLCYQLLHDPVTRNKLGAPFLVLTTPNVRQDKLDRLRLDGATIVPVPNVETDWAFTDVSTWQDVLSKLYLWKLTQYKLIAFLDNDQVLAKPLDGLFYDPAVATRNSRDEISAFKADEGQYPVEYVFAGIPEVHHEHHYPPMEETHDYMNQDYLNAGFFVTKPSLEMFNHQMKVLSIPHRFDPQLPEQNLWNYIYRRDGNMPWTQLQPTWNIHYPTVEDLEKGVASVHDKYWFPHRDNVAPFLLRWKAKMEDFYSARGRKV